MRQIQTTKLAELLMQLRFTPQLKRKKQLHAAEELLQIIDKTKEYPFAFICYKITEYHPREDENILIKGDQLFEDLQIFIWKLSGKLAEPVSAQEEKIFSIAELAEELNVSVKTVERWRHRGLPAKKYIFDDGIRRLGIMESDLERFSKRNPKFISYAVNFRRLSKQQKQQIITQARRLTAKKQFTRSQIIKKIAEKHTVAYETIRLILQEYERLHPEKPVFAYKKGTITPHEANEIFKQYKQNVSVPKLAQRFNRSRSTIYRIINQRRAMVLLAHRIEYIPSDEFLSKPIAEQILAEPIDLKLPDRGKSIESFNLDGEHLLPEYLQVLKTTPVLSREQEKELFRRYNYLKFLASGVLSGINLTSFSSKQITQAEEYLAEAEDIRRILVEANLRLVVSIASKHTTSGAAFLDLVSKGNYAIIQAVEEYDYNSSVRFGRRASLAISKEYAKVSGKDTELSRRKAASLANIQKDLKDHAADIIALERARHSLTQVIKEELAEREQFVVLNHFGLVGLPIKRKTKTLQQIGDELGLTKERVRQIELEALQKLRQCLSREEFELLTG
jgi:RNA polymerase primary sigma factor